MNKRTLFAGFIVLVIGIALDAVIDQILLSSLPHNTSYTLSQFASGSIIISYRLRFAGIISIIYGAILPDQPVHYDNNL